MSAENREAIAKEAGWTPESEWDPDKPPPRGGFKTADEFLDDGAMMLRSTNKQLQKLQKSLEESKVENKQLIQASQDAAALVQQQHVRDLEAQKRELEGRRQVAIEEGDGEAVQRTTEELYQLNTQPVQGQQVDPAAQRVVDEWVIANPWYTSDPDLRDIADGIGNRLNREGQIPPGPARLAAVEAEVRRLYSDRLSSDTVVGGAPGNPEGARTTTQRTSGRTFDDLPQDAQEAYHRMKKTNSSMTKPMYLKQYEWD